MMDLQKRERELKSLLDMAESLEERKKLRSELREIRQKMFEAPASDKNSGLQLKNAKDEVLAIVIGDSADQNNNQLASKQPDNGPRTEKQQSDFDKQPGTVSESPESLRAKPAEERAARRARRAQHMNLLKKEKEDSIDVPDSPKLNRHASSAASIEAHEEAKKDRPESEGPVAKTLQAVTVKAGFNEGEGDAQKKGSEDGKKSDFLPSGKKIVEPPAKTPLGRSATWAGKEKVTTPTLLKSAAAPLVPARSKFEEKVGKPFEFGTSYLCKHKDPVQVTANGRVGVQDSNFLQARSPNKYVPSQALLTATRNGPSEVTRGVADDQPVAATSDTKHSPGTATKPPARLYSAEEATPHSSTAANISLSAESNKANHGRSAESKAAIASIRRVASMRVQQTWKSAAPAEAPATSLHDGVGANEKANPTPLQVGQTHVASATNGRPPEPFEKPKFSVGRVSSQPTISDHEVGNQSSTVGVNPSTSSYRLEGMRPKSLIEIKPSFALAKKGSDQAELAGHAAITAVASAPSKTPLMVHADKQRSVTLPISLVNGQTPEPKFEQADSSGLHGLAKQSHLSEQSHHLKQGNASERSSQQPEPSKLQGTSKQQESTSHNDALWKPPPSGRNSKVFASNGSDADSSSKDSLSTSFKRLSGLNQSSVGTPEQPESPSRDEKDNRFSLVANRSVSPALVERSSQDFLNSSSRARSSSSEDKAHSSGVFSVRESHAVSDTKASVSLESRAMHLQPLSVVSEKSLEKHIGTTVSATLSERTIGSSPWAESVEFATPASPPPTISVSTDFEGAIAQSSAQASSTEPENATNSLEPPSNESYLYKRADPTPRRHHPSAPGLGGTKKTASVSKAAEEEQAKIDKEKQQLSVRQNLCKSSSTGNLTETTKDMERKEDDKKTTAPCLKKREKKRPVRRTMSISSIVLDWVQEMVSDYEDYGVEVKNFSSSWNNGMAFCALIHKFNPDAFDFSTLRKENKRHNFELAFKTGLERKNIPILLDVEDMIRMEKPEPRSVQCYVQWIWSVYGPTSGYGPSIEEIKQAQVA